MSAFARLLVALIKTGCSVVVCDCRVMLAHQDPGILTQKPCQADSRHSLGCSKQLSEHRELAMSDVFANGLNDLAMEELEDRCLLSAVVEGTNANDIFVVTVNESAVDVEVQTGIERQQFVFVKSEIQNGLVLLAKGGRDRIVVNGSDGREFANLIDRSFDIEGPDYEIRGRSFENVSIDGKGGNDVVVLSGTDDTDRLFSNPERSILASRGLRKFVFDFEDVTANALDGFDKASIFDSGSDETFVGDPNTASLSGNPNYNLTVNGFDRVTVRSIGGNDVAIFNGDDGDDRFVGRPVSAILRGVDNSYLLAAVSFERVVANGNGGDDIANLFGSNRDDSLLANEDRTTIAQGRFTKTAADFDRVNVNGISRLATDQGGADFAIFRGSNVDDLFIAKEDKAILKGENESFVIYLRGYETVRLNGTNDGDTELRILPSVDFDLFVFGE